MERRNTAMNLQNPWQSQASPNWMASWKSMKTWEDEQKTMSKDMQAEANLISRAEELQANLRKGEGLHQKIQAAMVEATRLQAQLDQAKRVISNFREDRAQDAVAPTSANVGVYNNWNPMAMAGLKTELEQMKVQHQQLMSAQVGHVEREQHLQDEIDKAYKQFGAFNPSQFGGFGV